MRSQEHSNSTKHKNAKNNEQDPKITGAHMMPIGQRRWFAKSPRSAYHLLHLRVGRVRQRPPCSFASRQDQSPGPKPATQQQQHRASSASQQKQQAEQKGKQAKASSTSRQKQASTSKASSSEQSNKDRNSQCKVERYP